jgi:hypothetical protein
MHVCCSNYIRVSELSRIFEVKIMQSSQDYSYIFPFRSKYFLQLNILKHIQSP